MTHKTEEIARETVGEYLRKERELRQISIEEVAEGTKISVRRLRFIEENKFDDLPAEIFIRGFIKNYAEYIGIDPQEAILRLDEDLKEQNLEGTPHEIADAKFEIGDGRNRFGVMMLLVAIVTALVVFVGIYFFWDRVEGIFHSGKTGAVKTNVTDSKNGHSEKNTPFILLEQEDEEKKSD